MLVNLMEQILDLDRLLDKSTLLQKPPNTSHQMDEITTSTNFD